MKLNFKTIVVIFLVALLGGSLGSIATSKLLDKENKNSFQEDVTISTITYKDYEPSDLSKTIDKAIDTVVEIHVTVVQQTIFGTSQGMAMGSGVIISQDGYIVTNHHVIENGQDIKVYTYDGNEYDGRLVGTDSRSDLAVIKIEADNLPYTSFADSDNLVLGQQVVAIGNPLGEGITCSEGIISALTKEVTVNSVAMDLLQTTAAINEGNSGGGLFDMYANIVGVVNAKSSATSNVTIEGMGYAIPSNNVRKIIRDLIENGYVKNRATLGISVYKSNSGFYSYYSDVSGCIVSDVVKDGAADKAGIKVGDIIIGIDDNVITSYTDLTKTLDKYNIYDSVEVTVNRNGKSLTFKVILQEAIN